MEIDGRVNAVRAPAKVKNINRELYTEKDKQIPQITMEDIKPDIKNNPESTIEKSKMEPDKLQNMVQITNKLISLSSYHLQFRIDEESERLQVKLIDNETNEIIREIPPDQMLSLSARIKEILGTFNKMLGVFIDQFA